MASDMGDGSNRLRDALGDEAFLRVADARRAAWRGGGLGLASGLFLGYGGASIAEAYRAAPLPVKKGRPAVSTHVLSCAVRNRAAVAAMAAGAACSFLGAIAGGAPAFNSLGDVWETILPRSGNRRAVEARDNIREDQEAQRVALVKALDVRAAARQANARGER